MSMIQGGAGAIFAEPRQLTVAERFRLIEIAHETKDPEVKREALSLLRWPMVPITAQGQGQGQGQQALQPKGLYGQQTAASNGLT